jgi:NAD(P)H-flavin reductase
MSWGCYQCKASGNPSGFKATVDELENHFATSFHPVKNAMGVIDPKRAPERCQHGWYQYGGQRGDRTRIEVGPHLLYGQEISESCLWERVKEGVQELTGGFFLGSGGPFGGGGRGKIKAKYAQSDMIKQRFHILDRVDETADTVTILTDFPDTWEAGQFSMLGAAACGEVPISFSGKMNGGTLQTIRKVGRVTSVLTALEPGATVTQRGPFGKGWQYQNAQGLLIIAGGCGICPLRHVLQTYPARCIPTLLYGARTEADFYFTRDLGRWEKEFEVKTIIDSEGLVTDLITEDQIKDGLGNWTTALVCGPEIMMKRTAEKLVSLGLPASQIQVSLERHMVCGLGLCEQCHCGGGRTVCKDGPVFTYDQPLKWAA